MVYGVLVKKYISRPPFKAAKKYTIILASAKNRTDIKNKGKISNEEQIYYRNSDKKNNDIYLICHF